MSALAGLLVTPAAAVAVLAVVRSYRASAVLNVVGSLLTLAFSLGLFFTERETGLFFFVDDFNIYLVVLTAFVGFTTSVFSGSYIRHELDIGRLVPSYLRFYHSMFQAFMGSLLLALVANNLGIMWVAVEAATLSTALMVSLYRTHEAIEAAWKYFILCGVGIALALFGTILMYFVAQPVMGSGLESLAWTNMLARVPAFDPVILNLAFIFLLIGYGTKVGLAPLHA